MSLLVRKIALSKWMQTDILNGALPSADAITVCSKTRNNTLSVWSIDAEESLDDAILAIASVAEHLDKIDVVLLERSAIENDGLVIAPVPGKTPFRKFRENHYDVCEMDYGSLGKLSQEIVRSIKMERCRKFTRGRLKNILASGIHCGKIDPQDLNDGIRKHIAS